MTDARTYATEAHNGQTYNGGPYTDHLQAVVEIVRAVRDPGTDLDYLETVAWLHDAVEDTEATVASVRDRFGLAVADAVDGLTDPEGHNRKTRKRLLHERLRTLDENFPTARAVLLVKTADRLANGRACVAAGNGRLKMYRGEHPAFRAAAHRDGLCDELWEELDVLLGD